MSEEETKFAICNTCKAKEECRGTIAEMFRTTNLIRDGHQLALALAAVKRHKRLQGE